MTAHLSIFFRLILCSFIILSCSDNSSALEAEKRFSEMYKNCEMNEKLKLSYVGKLFDGDESININLESISNTSVIFPSGYNVQLMSFNDKKNEWMDIKNNITYLPAESKYIIGTNHPVKEFAHTLFGVIPALDEKATLRIVIHGNVYQNDIETDQCTGAFIDFEFTP